MLTSTLTHEEHDILAWLCSIKHFNGSRGHRFIRSLSSLGDIFSLSSKMLSSMLTPAACKALINARKNISVASVSEKIITSGASFVSFFDSEYPEHLKDIPDAPLGLFVRGLLPSDAVPSVAVIGARSCSDYGKYIASELGSYLGKSGIQVISGMAYGIDGISQNAALSSGGTSYSVLGSGVDVCYPPSNKELYNHLCMSGGVISTYGMGEPAIAANFPPRNRIVSGLADAVVVIEARQKSGTIITVDMALEQGREVFAVPGRITDRLSDGCNGLIGQGANIYLSPEIFVADLFDYLSTRPNTRSTSNQINSVSSVQKLHRSFAGPEHIPAGLDDEQALVYSHLDLSPTGIEDICNRINATSSSVYTYSQVSMLLMQLMLEGHAKQISQGFFSKIL